MSAFTPRPWQTPVIRSQLDTPRVNIWSGMGTGKTVATLTALDAQLMTDATPRPALVIAPLRVAQSTWPDEAAKWGHLTNIQIQPLTGTPAQREKALRNPNASVFTINYENIGWLVEHLDGRWPFDTVIADESTRLKGFRLRRGGVRAAALAKVAHLSRRWVNLTGTPAPNGLADLWGQAWFLDQGERLGRSYNAFLSRWFSCHCPPGQQFIRITPYPHAAEQIQQRLADITTATDLAGWITLEQPVVNTLAVELPGRARDHYLRLEREMYAEIQGNEITAANAAVKTMKLLQIASGAIYTDEQGHWQELHSEKIKALESVISEAAGMPVLVAYHWKHDLERLLKAFPQSRHLDDDPQTIRDWNAGKIPVLLAHPASAGHGLNLQDGGNILVIFSHWWDLEHYQQIIERIGPVRQMQAGHNRPVYIHHIITRNTVDELVMLRRESKRTVQEILLDAMR